MGAPRIGFTHSKFLGRKMRGGLRLPSAPTTVKRAVGKGCSAPAPESLLFRGTGCPAGSRPAGSGRNK